MHKAVIADTSCFILLTKLGKLDLLHHIYGQITTTPEIALEYKLILPIWITIESAKNILRQNELSLRVDKGEASAIALALELPDSLLLIDDLKGRRLARELGISITGTIGIIVKAKEKGLIESVRSIMETIKSQTNFRFSEDIIQAALKQAGEI